MLGLVSAKDLRIEAMAPLRPKRNKLSYAVLVRRLWRAGTTTSPRGDDCSVRDAKRWEMRADRVGDVTRRQVRVVLFGHPRVGVVPEVNDITKEHLSTRPILILM